MHTSTTMNGLETDPRPIQSITTAGDSGRWIGIGVDGVTAIRVCLERGQAAYVPWFEVWVGDHLWRRVNAAHVEVVRYADPDPEPTP